MAAAKVSPSHWVGPRVRFSLFIALGILALAGAAAWGLDRPLPAENWNVRALARIEASAPSPLTFAVLGDSRNSKGVFDRLLEQAARDPNLAFVIHLGDMVHGGSEAGIQSFFGQVRRRLQIPLLAVLGNHDLEKGGGGSLWDRLFGPRYYAFRVQGHCFIVLNDAPGEVDASQWRWLTGELERAQACKTRLVFMHLPLFDPRGAPYHHALPPEVGQKLASLFQQYRVTHIFAGHIHGYFTSQWSGVPFTITGGGGARLVGTDPEHYFFHYLKVEIAGSQVRIQVQRLAGAPRAGEGRQEIHGK